MSKKVGSLNSIFAIWFKNKSFEISYIKMKAGLKRNCLILLA